MPLPAPIGTAVIKDKSSSSTAQIGSSSSSSIEEDKLVFLSVYEFIPYLNEFLSLATSLYNALIA
jgi:hypothetical protein